MAKGARASSKKINRTKLRARVFGPVEKARAERLHAKLLETVQNPKPEKTEMDTSEDASTQSAVENDYPKDMDIDGASASIRKSNAKDKRQARKELRKKPKNKMTFPTTRGKGALKPHSRSRVSKRRA